MKRLLLIPALCGFFIAQVQAAATDIGFSPWTKNVKWYRAAAESDLSSLTPSADTGTVACAWAVAENTIHTYNGTSWTTGGPCSTGSGSSSTSPAYVTIVDSSGDSAVDAAANAVKVLNYVSENPYTPAAVTVGAAATEIISLDVGAVSASRLTCNIVNDDTANNRTINVISIYLSPTGTYTDATAEYSSTDGGLSDWASPSGHLLMVRTGAPGAIADTTPDTSLDETDVLTFALDVAGFQTVGVKATASGAGGQVTPKCYYN